jgi:hypothetical protein
MYRYGLLATVVSPDQLILKISDKVSTGGYQIVEKDQHSSPLTMQGPAIYRIHVRGQLDKSWSDRVGGMQITETHGADGQTETILVGRLPDQAALTGILNSLYELHLPVLLVECVDSGNGNHKTTKAKH